MIRRWVPAAIPYVAVLIGLYGQRNVWVAVGLYQAGVLAVLIAERSTVSPGSLIRGRWGRIAGLLFVLCALNGPALYLLLPVIGVSPVDLAGRLAAVGLDRGAWIPFMLVYTLLTPWTEELFWRGRLGSASPAPDLSDLLFGGYHVLVLVRFLPWAWVLVSFGFLVGAGWLWRRFHRQPGGLAVPAITHLVADASTILAVWFYVH